MIGVYLLLRLLNFSLCMGLLMWAIEQGQFWILLTILPCYLYGSVLSVFICRLMGYHPKPEVRDIGAGAKKIFLPIFEKTSPDYAVIYASRHRGYQFLYESLRVILWSMLWPTSLLLIGLVMNLSANFFVIIVVVLLSVFVCLFLVEKLNKLFPKWFELEVILIEREWPIFKKKE